MAMNRTFDECVIDDRHELQALIANAIVMHYHYVKELYQFLFDDTLSQLGI